MSSIHPSENSYAVDQESSVEMARLLDQDALLTRHMGGLFPPDLELSGVHDILDIACGPGGWAMEVAFAHKDKQVTGIDISKSMLEYARARAAVQQLSNANFLYMDAADKLGFPDGSFDFVNARFIVGFMWKEAWPTLMQECLRILRPGGILRITDTDYPMIGITNSPALDKFQRLVCRGFYLTGRTFAADADSCSFGLTPMLRGFFQEAGFQDVRETPHMLNYSFGTDGYADNVHNMEAGMRLIIPFLVKTKQGSEEELDLLHQQMMAEMALENFCGICYFASVWGRKPAG